MKRLSGVGLLLVVLYAWLMTFPAASGPGNLKDIANLTGFFGILTIGVGLVIIAGGIDLSIGSVVALGAVGFVMLMGEGVHPYAAAGCVLIGGMLIGLWHGLLITQLKLQPFLVTLCGLFVYRGIARLLTEKDVGLTEVIKGGPIATPHPEFDSPLKDMGMIIGRVPTEIETNGRVIEVMELAVPGMLILLVIISLVAAYLLHASVFGRYWYAIGHNEQAARYSGIATSRHKIFAYMICSMLASLGGILYALDTGTVSPANSGQLYELYAITGAVLGGCSLRGGEGMVPGMLLGAAVLPVLENLILFTGAPDAAKYAIFGLTLLLGTVADQFFRAGYRFRFRRGSDRGGGSTS